MSNKQYAISNRQFKYMYYRMKNSFLLALIVCMLINIIPINSQTFNFSVSNQPYVDLQGGTALVTEAWDDPAFLVPIGFDFQFYGHSIQYLFMSDYDSFILLSGNLPTDTLDYFVLYGADLIDRGILDDTLLSPITYRTDGPSGNRVFTLEWENAGFYDDLQEFGISTEYVNLQLKLYESSGDIEYHYGPTSILRPEFIFEEGGPFVGLFEDYDLNTGFASGEVILLDGDPSNPEVVTEFLETYLDDTIPANTVYRFIRAPTGVNTPGASAHLLFYNPNPCRDHVIIKPELSDEVISPVRIINSAGETVRVDQQPMLIELGGLPPGIYRLQFKTTRGLVTQSISLVE